MSDSLLSSLFAEDERRPRTVSELNAEIRATLERSFSHVWLEAEISNFSKAASGHWYFTLTDKQSNIRATCFRGANWRIRFEPFNGLQVRVHGKISVYEPKGEYQIVVDSLEPVGEGARKIAFDQIKARLESEGLFDERLKRQLPFFPHRVGVVTSPRGAAYHDIVSVLKRRTRGVSITLIPTRVQGEGAGEEIRAAILLANEFNDRARPEQRIDVLIVGRGGGSAEDLWEFNDERLARAIRASKIPVISAVGHQIDWTIADLVADLRAATPSAAAEIVAHSEEAIRDFINQKRGELESQIELLILRSRNRLQMLSAAAVFSDFERRVADYRIRVESKRERIAGILGEMIAVRREALSNVRGRLSPIRLAERLSRHKTRLALLKGRNGTAALRILAVKKESRSLAAASLDALSPLKVLGRGYSIVQSASGRVVASVDQVAEGDGVTVRVADGRLSARVEEKVKD